MAARKLTKRRITALLALARRGQYELEVEWEDDCRVDITLTDEKIRRDISDAQREGLDVNVESLWEAVEMWRAAETAIEILHQRYLSQS